MIASYQDKNIVNLLIGKADLERIDRQLPIASIARLSGTGERVFVGYIEYKTTSLAEPTVEVGNGSIDLLLPRHYRAADLIAQDEVYLEIRSRSGVKDARLLRLNIQPNRDVPI